MIFLVIYNDLNSVFFNNWGGIQKSIFDFVVAIFVLFLLYRIKTLLAWAKQY